jgi:succinoglycan biosynthesis transport protein ExoP
MSSEWTSSEEPAAPELPHEPIQLAEYWHIVVKRWRLIALCVAAGLLAAAAVSVLSKPAYKAVAVLEVGRPAGTQLGVGAIGDHSAPYDSEFFPTQMRLMKSREIAERVVRKLGLAKADAPPTPPRAAGTAKTETLMPLDPVTRAAIGVQSGIDTQPERGTNLVDLSYVASSAARAADLANAVADAYIEWTIDARLRAAGDTSQFLNGQIEQFKAEVATREQELLAFRRQKDLTTDSKTNLTNLDALNADYTAAVRDRVAREARLYEVRNARTDALASVQSDGALSQARAEQARLEREYADKLGLFKPEWPAMQQLKAQIDKGRLQIQVLVQEAAAKARAAAESDYQTAVRREETLKSELRSQETAVLHGAELEYNEKKLELQTKQALLDSLLKRKAEADVLAGLAGERISNVRIVDRALPPGAPFRPSYSTNGLLGLFGGAILGLGLAFFVSHLDRSLRTPEQVEQALQLPALGVIPLVGTAGSWTRAYSSSRLYPARKKTEEGAEADAIELFAHRHPRSQVAEAYRAFRASLLLSRAGGVRSIVVTSSVSQEGKTATAVNLAIVLSQLGKRVLLVDADLHRPRLHELLRVSNRTGLVSILAENVKLELAIAKTDVPDLSVLPSGPASPNPSGLLASEAMSGFLDFVRRSFDHVILDTPPVLAVADTLLLAHQTDGVVLCVRSGATPREQVMRTRDRMLRSGIRILGVLINGVEEGVAYGEVYAYDEGSYAPRRASPDKPAATASRPK